MFCWRWVCRWNALVPPSVSHLASGQLRKKSPLLGTPLTESRSEPKTRANMPLLRQLEFEFQTTDPLTSILSLRERRTKSRGEDQVVPSIHDGDLERKASQ